MSVRSRFALSEIEDTGDVQWNMHIKKQTGTLLEKNSRRIRIKTLCRRTSDH